METLEAWLAEQGPGFSTFRGFQKRALEQASFGEQHVAFYRLLAHIVGNFVTRYDGEPLEEDIANAALARLRSLTAHASQVWRDSAEAQLTVLNEIARTDLG
jgi:hypothetical protein